MRKIIRLFFAVAFMFTCTNVFSQSTIVMKAKSGTTTLNGGSTVAGHVGEIDLFSYSHGESFCEGCNKPDLSDFNFLTFLSHATTTFKKLLLNGTKLTSVDVAYINGSGFTFYKIHMENIFVRSVQESGSTGADV